MSLARYYTKFFFWFYASIGFLSLTYISFHSIFIGPITIYYDWLKPFELFLFTAITLTFLTKSIHYVKKMFHATKAE